VIRSGVREGEATPIADRHRTARHARRLPRRCHALSADYKSPHDTTRRRYVDKVQGPHTGVLTAPWTSTPPSRARRSSAGTTAGASPINARTCDRSVMCRTAVRNKYLKRTLHSGKDAVHTNDRCAARRARCARCMRWRARVTLSSRGASACRQRLFASISQRCRCRQSDALTIAPVPTGARPRSMLSRITQMRAAVKSTNAAQTAGSTRDMRTRGWCAERAVPRSDGKEAARRAAHRRR